MLRRRFFSLLMAIMIMLCIVPAFAEEGENLLINGSFEDIAEDGLPVGWFTDAYIRKEGYTVFSYSINAQDGEYCASVNNLAMNDARFAQTVDVIPASLYCLSGWIKVDSMVDSGWGANLSIEGLYAFSEGIYDADGEWHYVEMYGETGEDQYEVTVFARVGGYSGESEGRAYFDNLSLREVKAVPGDGIASLWFEDDYEPEYFEPYDDDLYEAAEAAKPFWPWLSVMGIAYALWCVLGSSHWTRDVHELKEDSRNHWRLWLYMLFAALIRVFIGVTVEGYQVDVNCFLSWGNTMAEFGPASFYQATSFCDYTPAYIYIMGINSMLNRLGNAAGLQIMAAFYHKIIPMMCDMAGAILIYHFARRNRFAILQAETLALLVALNPAAILTSAAWCQIDSVLCLGLLLVAWLAVERKWQAVLPVYVICALIKPQALMLGPLGLLVLVYDWIRFRENTRQILLGFVWAVIAAAAVILPFYGSQEPGWLIAKYAATLASYPYATVNTANLYYLFGANWQGITATAGILPSLTLCGMCLAWACVLFLRRPKHRLAWIEPALMAAFATAYAVMAAVGVSWSVLGFTAMGLAFAVVLPMYLRSGDLRHLPLLGAVLFILLYTIGIKMHERYLLPALLLLAYAFTLHRDRRILLLFGLLSCTVFVNSGIVLDNSIRLGSAMGHLNQDTQVLNILLSLVNMTCAIYSVWVSQRICVEKSEPLSAGVHALSSRLPRFGQAPCHALNYTPDHRLYLGKTDWLLMLAVTAVYAFICLSTLGSTKAPQDPWKSTSFDEAVIIDLGEQHKDFSVLYFSQVSYDDFSVAVSDDGATWSEEYWAEMNQGECFRWKYLVPSWETSDGGHDYANVRDFENVQKLSGRYVRITSQQIGLILNEVIFRSASGVTIPAEVIDCVNANPESTLYSDPAALLNEQDTLEGEPGWYTGTYFDEIYHARTAFEHLNQTSPYETSHPPLGKVIMSWFVGIFGMTPFGWRFAGALTGILMLPAMYLLTKQLTKRTGMAFTAMLLMALDCMHFTQTRIATIDSFPVLFIILSYWMMARFMQRDIVLTPLKKLLPDLALSGFFMGCGVASKWIGAYAGIGLAVLYFWTCARHIRLAGSASRLIADGAQDETLLCRIEHTWKRVIILCLWCLLLFVAVPLGIYLLSYVPHFAYAHKEGLSDFLRMVWNANFAERYGMLAYHSQPGFGMDHPFYSPWYEWPLIIRPMYYSMAEFVPDGMSYAIFAFGNPAVWLAGLGGLAFTLYAWGREHLYLRDDTSRTIHATSSSWSIFPAFVLIGFLAQYLPWVLVPRGTYIYHYFASVPFLILAIVLIFHNFSAAAPRLTRAVLWIYLLLSLVCFIGLFPYASGVLTPTGWLDWMKQFLRIYY